MTKNTTPRRTLKKVGNNYYLSTTAEIKQSKLSTYMQVAMCVAIYLLLLWVYLRASIQLTCQY